MLSRRTPIRFFQWITRLGSLGPDCSWITDNLVVSGAISDDHFVDLAHTMWLFYYFILKFQNFEILKFCNFEILKFWNSYFRVWNFEILKFWNGVMQSFGMTFWNLGILKFRNFKISKFRGEILGDQAKFQIFKGLQMKFWKWMGWRTIFFGNQTIRFNRVNYFI